MQGYRDNRPDLGPFRDPRFPLRPMWHMQGITLYRRRTQYGRPRVGADEAAWR
jgi:hypothetical protein